MLGFIRDRRRLNDRLGLDDRLRLNHGSDSLNLGSTPGIRLNGLSLYSGFNNSGRLFNNQLSLLHHGSTPRIGLHGLGLRSTPRIRLHRLSLRSTPRIRLHRLSLRSTPCIRLHRLSLYSGFNNSGRLFNNRLSLLHHGSNSLNDRLGLNRRSFLRNGRRLGSGLLHRRCSLSVGFDRLCRGSDGSRLRNGRMSGNNTPVCQPLGKRRIQRRVRGHVGVQIRASGGDISEILRCQRRIAHVSSGELRQIKSAHLYSSRTRRRSS